MVARDGQTRLSVVVPCFNTERYLGLALSSLERVDMHDLEVLLVNDGSTDGSLALMRACATRDARFRVIDKPNEGYGASVNRGIDEARGTYVGILEPDDFLYDGALECLLEVALATNADVVKGDFTFYWSREGGADEPARIVTPDMVGHAVDTRQDPRIFRAKASIWSALYRRAFLDEWHIRCLSTPGASFQDTSFGFKAFAAARDLRFVDTAVVHYRQDNEASSVKSKDKARAVVGEFDEIDRWLASEGRLWGKDALVREAEVSRFNAYLWNIDRLAGEVADDFVSEAAAWYVAREAAGALHVGEWDAWRRRNLRALERDPERYLRQRQRHHGSSALAKVRFALALGGPVALLEALRERAGRA